MRWLACLALVATPASAQVSYPPLSGVPAYAQYGFGTNTTGANTTTLLTATNVVYGNGSSNGLPLLRCDYPGQSYRAELTGDYGLAATNPGTVTAIIILGGTSTSAAINNLLVGTNGAWWDAYADITCVAPGASTSTVLLGANITFQATGNVTASQPVNRTATTPTTVAMTNGAFTFDLQRTFTNAANTMRVDTLVIYQVR